MSERHPQSDGMKALEQSLNDHMEICQLKRKAKRLKAHNARLKAEVDKLTPKKPAFFTWTDKTFIDKVEFDKLKAENEKLETEVASIGSEYMAATRHYNSLHNNLQAENERLKATMEKVISTADKIDEQNQRLIKAGDAMADEIIGCYNAEGYDPADSETLPKWNAAKEGKPSV